MDSTSSCLLNSAIHRFVCELAERVSFCPPIDDDSQTKEPMLLAGMLVTRYAELIGQDKVTAIVQSPRTAEEKLALIQKELEKRELEEDGISLGKRLSK